MKHQTQFRPELVDSSVFIAAGAILVGDVFGRGVRCVSFSQVPDREVYLSVAGSAFEVNLVSVLTASSGWGRRRRLLWGRILSRSR